MSSTQPIDHSPFEDTSNGNLPSSFNADTKTVDRYRGRYSGPQVAAIAIVSALFTALAMSAWWSTSETGSWTLTDWPPYGVSSVSDISDPNDLAVSDEFSGEFFNPSYYEVTLENNGDIWSYDDRRGYGGVTAINPLGTGWPNDISWSEIEGGEQKILFCWAPTQDEAVNIALDAVEFGEGFGRDELRGFGEEAERVEYEPHCKLASMF